MSWTDERIEALKRLWAEGLSGSEIAAELGRVSRNAVIGKVNRLGLTGRAKSAPVAPRAPKRGRPSRPGLLKSPVHWSANVPADDAVPTFPQDNRPADAPLGAPAAVSGLTEHTCRWPEGDVSDPKFRFCCAEPLPSTPYCGAHTRMAFDFGARTRAVRRGPSIAKLNEHQERPREPASQH